MLVIDEPNSQQAKDGGKQEDEWHLEILNAKDDNGGPEQNGEPAESKLEQLASKIPCLGIMMSLTASLFLATANVLVKLTHSVSGIQVAVFRAIIQLVVYTLMILIRRVPLLPERGERLPVFGRAILGGISITCSYYGLKLIPLGDATTIRFSLPIWTLIIGYLILNEPCSLLKVAAVLASVVGVLLIAKPDTCMRLINLLINPDNDDEALLASQAANLTDLLVDDDLPQSLLDEMMTNQTATTIATNTTTSETTSTTLGYDPMRHLEGCLLALASSVLLSLAMVFTRMSKKTPAEVNIFWLSIVSILVGSQALTMLNKWRLPADWIDWMLVILNGVCGSIGQFLFTNALKIEQSGVISLARTFDIQIAFLYSAFLLHELILPTSIAGSLIVSLSVVTTIIPGWLDRRREKNKAQH